MKITKTTDGRYEVFEDEKFKFQVGRADELIERVFEFDNKCDTETGFCDWCDGGAADLVYNMDDGTVGGYIDEGMMYFYRGAADLGSRKIRYCPMCGRNLREDDNGIC